MLEPSRLEALPTTYIFRHGQTDWNAERRFQGQVDVPLNDLGRRQADENGRILKELLGEPASNFAFVSSPLGRTRETMERARVALGMSPGDYSIDPLLIEVCFGEWERHTLDELEQKSPETFARREADKWSFVPPGKGGESYEMLAQRTIRWLSALDRPTICSTHGGIIRTLFHLVNGMSGREASAMTIHQGRVLRLQYGHIEWL